jgi:hypothetical protein
MSGRIAEGKIVQPGICLSASRKYLNLKGTRFRFTIKPALTIFDSSCEMGQGKISVTAIACIVVPVWYH